ncbi:MAG: thiaminase/transcriptional activator TenA [Gammaproteobacteria bacterium]
MKTTLFATLKAHCAEDWNTYITHAFVRGVGDGSLPRACFEHYLKQDYLFLLHFARAYALAVYKSTTLADMRHAKNTLAALLDEEISLHTTFCAGWGISEAQMLAEPEATANMAYTRYVLETGNAGDLLDLHAALVPCVVGYAEVASWLMKQPSTTLDGNPYRDWIEMYASDDYQSVAASASAQLDDLGARLGGEARIDRLSHIFHDATRLEIGFWQMGLDRSL